MSGRGKLSCCAEKEETYLDRASFTEDDIFEGNHEKQPGGDLRKKLPLLPPAASELISELGKRKMYENLTEIKIVVWRSHAQYRRAVYRDDFFCFV